MRCARLLSTFVLLAGAAHGADEWRPLWNGQDFSGWSTFLTKPDPAWEVPGLKRAASGKYLEVIGKNRDPLKVFVVQGVVQRDRKPRHYGVQNRPGLRTARLREGNH